VPGRAGDSPAKVLRAGAGAGDSPAKVVARGLGRVIRQRRSSASGPDGRRRMYAHTSTYLRFLVLGRREMGISR
jgi:hypothetical protein